MHSHGQSIFKYNPAWLEDLIPWQYTDLWKQITAALDVPTITGEDIFLKEPFEVLCREHAVDIIHPDLANSGGIRNTQNWGYCSILRGSDGDAYAGSPISCFAKMHCAAATENFLVLENHSGMSPTGPILSWSRETGGEPRVHQGS